MAVHTIGKDFNFCFGHRVWSQQLDRILSEDAEYKCRHLHGHEGIITVSLIAAELELGMVTDFTNLTWFKTFIDKFLDHKFIMDLDDPLRPHLLPAHDTFQIDDREGYIAYTEYGFWTPNLAIVQSREMKELYGSYVIVPFIPTSENLSKWFFKIVEKRMTTKRVKVESVVFRESAKSFAKFY